MALVIVAAGCRPEPCPRCETLVITALGEPDALVPPLVWESVGRDIGDLVFERLARPQPGAPPDDPAGYLPALAERWEAVGADGWRFHLRPGARWHDGRPVTAEDVVFSFEAFADPALDAPARADLEGLRVTADGPGRVLVEVGAPGPGRFLDAVYHVRIFPRHLWDTVPRDRWGADPSVGRLVGSGPYRVVRWERGASLTLEATGAGTTGIPRVVWRFAESPDAAGNLVLSGEADLLETIPDPARRPEFARDTSLVLLPYPSAVYGFLGFNLRGAAAWADPGVRRALTLAVDRDTLTRAIFGPESVVPPGPMSRQLWLYDPAIIRLPHDPERAAALLDSAGWRRDGTGPRRRAGGILSVDILVPATSATRRQLAVAIQERWGRLGVRASVTPVDFPVFQERLRTGRFDTYIGAWLDQPSPRGLVDQWTRAGWDGLNYGRYANPVFDSLLAAALAGGDTARTRRRWVEAMDTLAADAPAIWLFTPTNVAVASTRLRLTSFHPFAWLADLPNWRLTR